jgi:hypothetical protein
MKALGESLRELFGLFVDDGSLALALIAWTALAAVGLQHLPLPPESQSPILFLGYLAILAENLWRTARRR